MEILVKFTSKITETNASYTHFKKCIYFNRVLLDFLVPLVNVGHLYFSRKLEILNLFQIFHIFGLNLFKVAIIIFKNLNINPLY